MGLDSRPPFGGSIIRGMARRGLVGLTAGIAFWLAAVSPASAADYYVDLEGPDPDDFCLVADPCNSIAEAIDLADTNPNLDTIHVAPSVTPYPTVTVPNSPMTLVGNDYAGVGGGTAPVVIDGVAARGVQFSAGAALRAIRGFTIRGGDSNPVVDSSLGGTGTNITVQNNVFDDAGAGVNFQLDLDGSPAILGNTFTGAPDNTGPSNGIRVESAAAPMITGNTLSGLVRAIDVTASPSADGTTISGNTVQLKRTDLFPSAGVFLQNITGTIADNTITGVDSTGVATGSAAGIYAGGGVVLAETLALRHNRIFDIPGPVSSSGVNLVNQSPTTLSGDVIAGSPTNIITTSLLTQLSLTNVTLWGATNAELLVSDGQTVAIDSSIVGTTGISDPGTGTCASSFSRSPTAGSCAFGIGTPSFVDAAGDNYHLTPAGNGPFVDQGNPGAPADPLDLDGDPRALDGLANGSCLPRRDVGADEVAGLSPDCTSPNPSATGPTGRRAAALKKCKKKKKKKKKQSAKKRKRCRKKAKKQPV